MDSILVPKQGTSTSAYLFAACFDAGTSTPVDLRVEVRNSKGGLVARYRNIEWRAITPSRHLPKHERVHFYAHISVQGLDPGTMYRARLGTGTKVLASAEFGTLPTRLYKKRPFNILLASCFHERRDKQGAAGAAAHALPAKMRPHVKLLVGDQVYLDMPARRFARPHRPKDLAKLHLETYRRTWGQSARPGTKKGFAALLRRGLTWCIADDHEFWNNYPQATQFLIDTTTAKRRSVWHGISRSLFNVFQAPAGISGGRPSTFDVGRLAFLTLDTRYNRGARSFLSTEQREKLPVWCARVARQGKVGVVAISQPMFDECGTGNDMFDRNLACFRDHTHITKIFNRCPQPILFLSGDVHFGRVSAGLRHDGTVHRAEVLSSPLQNLLGKDARTKKPPREFPLRATSRGTSLRVQVVRTTEGSQALFRGDQFATLSFTEDSDQIEALVRHWSADEAGKLLGETRLRFAPGNAAPHASRNE